MDTGSNWFTSSGGTHMLVAAADNTNNLHFKIESGGTSTTHGTVFGTRGGALAAFASETRKFQAGGSYTDNTIDFYVFQTAGNASDFGDRTATGDSPQGVANATRGVMTGGWRGHCCGTNTDMDYITMDTAGNATSFGQSYSNRQAGSTGNDTRGIFFGGYQWFGAGNMYVVGTMEYITIGTTGNATSFGTNIANQIGSTMGSNATRGLTSTNSTSIGYVTIGTTGNASSFGSSTHQRTSSADNAIVAVLVGGSGGQETTTEQVNIDTTGNATSFNLTMNANVGSNGCNSASSYVEK